jgi:3,2-trans-enoyl-CoA isomerase
LITAITEAVAETDAPALVISGAPGMFSAGLDVPHLLTLDRDGMFAAWRSFVKLTRTLIASRVPIAAAITGHAPAGGAVISICCDWRVMAAGEFRIGLNEVQVGIILPEFLLDLVARIIGPRQAERLTVGGLMLPPEEAVRIGLVDEVAPPGEIVARAVRWCERLLTLPREIMLQTRSAARERLLRVVPREDSELVARLVDNWFRDDTQAALHALVERLRQG